MMDSAFVKKSFFSVLLVSLCALLTPSCKKVVDQVFPSGFDFPLTDIPAIIPAIPFSNYTIKLGRTDAFNLDSTVKSQSNGLFSGSKLTSIKVKKITIRLQNADSTNNMANFQVVSVGLYSNTNTTPITLATANVPDTFSSTLNMDAADNPEILPYLKGTQISITVTLTTRRGTTHSLNALTDITLTVK